MMFRTTEITSPELTSDNPLHQRLLKPYIEIAPTLHGNLLEVGCGVGRGLEILRNHCDTYTGIDKNAKLIDWLKGEYPAENFIAMHIPPFAELEDNTYDFLVNFQVIEHIQDDDKYVSEIYRVLKPGGKAIFTTPNRKRSLTRNPWHVREYFSGELIGLLRKYFPEVDAKGIAGNEKIEEYLKANKESVEKITRWDFLKLQYRLPRWMLQVPYDVLNRVNRNKLQSQAEGLVIEIKDTDYFLTDDLDNCLDFYFIATK